MGLILSRVRRIRKIVFLGITNAGKSSIISVLENEYSKTDARPPMPTRGSRVTFLNKGNRHFMIWELGGEQRTIQFWKCYFPKTDGVAFVIDGSDTANKHEAVGLLCSISREKSLDGAAVVVLVTKSCTDDEVAEIQKNGAHIFQGRKFRAFKTSIDNPSTILEAFEWFREAIG